MKVTLELPDDLVQAIKLRALHQRRRFKDVMAEYLQVAINLPPRQPGKAGGGTATTLPVLKAACVTSPQVTGWSPQQMSDWIKEQALEDSSKE